MKIGFVNDFIYPFFKGGIEKRVWLLALSMAEQGHDVHLFTTKLWSGPRVITVDRVTVHGVCRPRRAYTKRGRRSILQGLLFAFWLPWSLARRRVDVLDCQATCILACFPAWVAAKLTGARLIITWQEVWGRYWFEYLGPLGWIGLLLERLVTKLSGSHVAGSEATRARLCRLGLQNVVLVPNGVDLQEISQAPPSPRSCDLIYVGRLIKEKRLDLLIEALRTLAERGHSPQLWIVGDGPERPALERLAEKSPGCRIRMLGTLESSREVFSLMKAARIFAFPSMREGFGIAALEALACGLPVVTLEHENNAARELVKDGVTGFRTNPDPGAFAVALEKLLEDPGLVRSMSLAARHEVPGKDWRVIAGVLEDHFLRILGASDRLANTPTEQRSLHSLPSG